jgi:1-phosphatidylinositol-4-phosphate 5-kinase
MSGVGETRAPQTPASPELSIEHVDVGMGRAPRRVGTPATHKVKHRGLARDGTITFKQQPVSQLELNIQRGIRAIVDYAKEASQQSNSDELTRSDCNQVYRVRIPADHEIEGAFTSKSHAPRAFRHVRKVLGVSDEHFVDSICDHRLTMLKTPGKSGALFFKSADGRYLLKTVSKGESKFFRSILHDYVLHVESMTVEHRLRTLIPHFYELIHIDTPAGRNIRLVIMNNLAPVDVDIHEAYDLKGSWVGRWTKEAELAKPGVTLKDLDAVHHLACSSADRDLVVEQIRRDSAWLEARGVIDYSLLCLYHFPARAASAQSAASGTHAQSAEGLSAAVAAAAPLAALSDSASSQALDVRGRSQVIRASTSAGEEVHVFYGIIDVLQSWRLFKRAEHALKAIRYPTQIAGVSVTDPSSYARRFRSKLVVRFTSYPQSPDPPSPPEFRAALEA